MNVYFEQREESDKILRLKVISIFKRVDLMVKYHKCILEKFLGCSYISIIMTMCR